MARRNYYRRDPFWLVTRYAGACVLCDAPIPKGSRAWYWPYNKQLECESCGTSSSARFEAEAADEYAMGGF